MHIRRNAPITALLAITLTGVGSAQEEPLYVQVEKLLASDGGFADFFGDTLAIDGDTVVVGGDDIGLGGAYVYDRNHGGSNAWGEVKKLLAPDVGEGFGYSVEIQGDLIAVGGFVTLENPGAVYFFERNEGGAGNWGFTGMLMAPDDADETRAFNTPALSGETLLVGASSDGEAGRVAAGAVYVFTRDELAPDGWRFEEKILNPDPETLDRFGQVIDIDGDTFVATAPQDSEYQDRGGAVYIYQRGNGQWLLQRKLSAPEPQVRGEFGLGLALEGDLLVVGHPGEDGNDGGAYLYARDLGPSGNWGLQGTLVTQEENRFGVSVDLHQGTIVVGNDLADLPGAPNGGTAHVFEKRGAAGWVEISQLSAADPSEGQQFGTAVGILGRTALSGADADDEQGLNAGAAYLFQAVASPGLTVTGTCPGELTLELAGATPSGTVFLGHSASEGETVLPGGQCPGLELGLEDAALLTRFLVDDDGSRSLMRVAPEAACGRFLQAVDGVTCGVGPVTQLP